jgi:photosystem II stability/assembly factor-like uncharacterized protein
MQCFIPNRPGLRRAPVLAAAAVAVALTMPSLRAQAPAKADAAFLVKAYDTYRSMRQASPYKGIEWQYLGPRNISGRATDVAVADRAASRRIYVAYATSGVWKTDDNGTTWQSIFDDYPVSSIGDLAVAPTDPNIVWVGAGEANIFRASMPGAGIYKSTDGGKSFRHAGLTDTGTIARILVHPSNAEIVYVAASGNEWTDNGARGVFKTIDGGKTWTKIFYRSSRTGASDLVMDPTDPDTLYASMWQRIRRKWSDPRVEPGYTEGGVWKSTDAGKTWIEVNAGLPPASARGRIGIDIARSNPSVLYAFVDNYEPGRPPQENERDAYGRPIHESRIKSAEIYRTSDKGATWTKVSPSDDFMNRHSGTYGWVFGQIRVDPTDENTIYTMGLGLHVSRDAGKTYTTLRGMHGDHHGLWIDPKDPSILYNANDGGFYQSSDAGKTWTFAVTAGGAQFYNVTVDGSNPPWAYGSIQDHGSYRARIDLSAGRDAIPAVSWESAPGGEGSYQAVDPGNPNIVYSHGFYGNFTRTDLSIPAPARGRRGGPPPSADQAKPAGPQRVTNIRPKDEDLRAQWMAPIIVSPHDRNTIYAGYQFVFKSTSRGDGWQKISPDLTSNDPARMLLKSSNAIPYQTITALAESIRVKGLLYAGTDDGKLHVTRNGGESWTDLTKALPTTSWIARVVPSEHAEGTVYVTQRGREDDDHGVYIYRSADYGQTFASIRGNVPAGSVNVIREDPTEPQTLYIGTDFGAFVTRTGGRTWHVLGSDLPSVQVSDLAVQPRDNLIVISTYGRGMYVMDALKVRAVK